MNTLSLLRTLALGTLTASTLTGCVSFRASTQSPRLERIAFGSCLHQTKPQPLWDDVIATRPDLFLFGGDNGYIDTDKPERFAEVYGQLNQNPGLQNLRAACRVLGTWDDHDYGRNDAGKSYPLKNEAKSAFADFFKLPPSHPVHARGGIYQSYTFGPRGQRVQLLILDTRWFRDDIIRDKRSAAEKKAANTVGWYVPHTDTTPTLLGEEQWNWLEDHLKQKADVRILLSSVQFAVDGRGMEGWTNFPHERQRLFKLIESTRAAGVIVLSGDVHFCELSRRDDAPYPIYDFTSSGMGHSHAPWSRSANPHRVPEKVNAQLNFGSVAINWDAKNASGHVDPIITFTAHGDNGVIHFSHEERLSNLQFPDTL